MMRLIQCLALLAVSVPARAGFFGPFTPATSSPTWTGAHTFVSTVTVRGNAFSVGTSTLAVTQGRVGIGNTSPVGALDVTGSGQFSSTLTVQGNAFSVGGSTFVVTASSVGIGVAAPLNLLHINSKATPDTSQFQVTANGLASISAFAYGADNLGVFLDAHYKNGGWVSADAGSNFGMYKLSDKLKLVYDDSVGVGAAVTWNDGLVMDTAGLVGINATSPAARLEIKTGVADNYALQISSQNGTSLLRVDRFGHLISSGAAPTLGACTNGVIMSTATDTTGRISISGGTNSTCTLNFAAGFDSEPNCFCNSDNASGPPGAVCIARTSTTTSAIFIPASGSFADGDHLHYFCIGTRAAQ